MVGDTTLVVHMKYENNAESNTNYSSLDELAPCRSEDLFGAPESFALLRSKTLR